MFLIDWWNLHGEEGRWKLVFGGGYSEEVDRGRRQIRVLCSLWELQ